MLTAFRSIVFAVIFACSAQAKPLDYSLAPNQSKLEFTYVFGKDRITGSFPDFDAQISIDFERVNRSSVTAQIKTTTARGGFPFASQALKSARMLAAEDYPLIEFKSQNVSGSGNSVDLEGNISIKGVTRPIKLTAKLFKDDQTFADGRDNIIIVITGALNRHDFGVSGWPDDVAPTLEIEITARLLQRILEMISLTDCFVLQTWMC